MSLRSAALRASTALFTVATFGCSSASFDVAGGGDDTGAPPTDSADLDTSPSPDVGSDVIGSDGGSDSGTDGGSSDGGIDTNPILDASPDAIPIEAGTDAISPCSVLAAAAPDLYVDATSKKPSNGTSDCPFHTIREATELSWILLSTRTIHVVGGTSASVVAYNETGVVVVRNNIALVGPGVAARITGGGSCPVGSGNCIVEIEPGGAVDGFAVLPPTGFSGNAIVLNNGIVVAPAKIKNVQITGAPAGQGALVVKGASDIGPGMNLSTNGANGINVIGSGNVHIIGSSSGDNLFNTNANNGISIDVGATATLTIDAATTSGNSANGVRIANGSKHVISKLIANGNVNQGVVVYSGGSLAMHGSTLTGNKMGLVFIQSSSSTLDIGTSPDAGNNVFGGATAKNTLAGVCVSILHGMTFNGDSFTNCTPVSIFNAPCDGLTTYNDVVYSSSTGATASVSACAVGP